MSRFNPGDIITVWGTDVGFIRHRTKDSYGRDTYFVQFLDDTPNRHWVIEDNWCTPFVPEGATADQIKALKGIIGVNETQETSKR